MPSASEVYAAREKNGIYIPRDRYLSEEAEKKVMAEKIERMALEADSKDKATATSNIQATLRPTRSVEGERRYLNFRKRKAPCSRKKYI
ncbi:kinesin-like protein KIN-5D [Arachis ipaensis]|uniref:kinesin-like protein KIN-5D n=1 Tax=Arachis ipaensis TaxID=130454 RepID=UPI000A2B7032|nr:kinesin-like protein KIN-5D [Arachis ipaensis]